MIHNIGGLSTWLEPKNFGSFPSYDTSCSLPPLDLAGLACITITSRWTRFSRLVLRAIELQAINYYLLLIPNCNSQSPYRWPLEYVAHKPSRYLLILILSILGSLVPVPTTVPHPAQSLCTEWFGHRDTVNGNTSQQFDAFYTMHPSPSVSQPVSPFVRTSISPDVNQSFC